MLLIEKNRDLLTLVTTPAPFIHSSGWYVNATHSKNYSRTSGCKQEQTSHSLPPWSIRLTTCINIRSTYKQMLNQQLHVWIYWQTSGRHKRADRILWEQIVGQGVKWVKHRGEEERSTQTVTLPHADAKKTSKLRDEAGKCFVTLDLRKEV